MLSLFPQILFLSPFAALLIRISLATLFVLSAWKLISRHDTLPKLWGVVELVAAAALFVGLWTQGVALFLFVLMAVSLISPRVRVYPTSTVILTLVMLATLVVTGAGALAFDLPL